MPDTKPYPSHSPIIETEELQVLQVKGQEQEQKQGQEQKQEVEQEQELELEGEMEKEQSGFITGLHH